MSERLTIKDLHWLKKMAGKPIPMSMIGEVLHYVVGLNKENLDAIPTGVLEALVKEGIIVEVKGGASDKD